jgi:hypothetical protein
VPLRASSRRRAGGQPGVVGTILFG